MIAFLKFFVACSTFVNVCAPLLPYRIEKKNIFDSSITSRWQYFQHLSFSIYRYMHEYSSRTHLLVKRCFLLLFAGNWSCHVSAAAWRERLFIFKFPSQRRHSSSRSRNIGNVLNDMKGKEEQTTSWDDYRLRETSDRTTISLLRFSWAKRGSGVSSNISLVKHFPFEWSRRQAEYDKIVSHYQIAH